MKMKRLHKGLIYGEEAFKLPLASHVWRTFFDKLTIALEPGAINIFGAQGQVFAPDDLSGALQSFLGLHLAPFNIGFSIYEQVFVYS